MSVFTPKEIEYMLSQKLGRLATIDSAGKPQVAPVGFRYNAELDVIEIGGRAMSATKKYRNIQKNPNVALVIDDVLPPWRPRGIEIRGTAEDLPTGGKAMFSGRYDADDAIIRITPLQLIGWGLEEGRQDQLNRKVNQKNEPQPASG
jgi:pyridoxamine 5'-phosphate oxidase family protein